MEFHRIIDELEEIVTSSPRIPMTRRVLVDEDRVLDLIDRLRTALPEDIREAQQLLRERERLLADSREEAKRIVENARREVERRAEENEVVRQARSMAEEIVEQAEKLAREIRTGARDYADDILAELEKQIHRLLAEVQNSRMELEKYNP